MTISDLQDGGRGVFPRPRVRRTLDSGADLVVVRAPEGSGRTATVAEWARDRREAVAWVAVDTATSSRESFWNATIAALAESGALPVDADLLITRGSFASVSDLRRLLVRELRVIRQPVTLIVDDFDTVDDLRVADDLVAVLIAHPALRIIAITAAHGPLESDAVRVELDTAIVTADDLVLTRGELAELATRQGISDDSAVIEVLYEVSGGRMPLASDLLAQVARERSDAESLPSRLRELQKQALQGTIRAASAEERQLAKRLAVAERLTPQLVRALTGSTDPASVLAAGERHGYLRRIPGPARYRFDPITRDALLESLWRNHPGEARRLTALVARDDLDAARYLPALRAAVACGDLNLAHEVCARGFMVMLGSPKEIADILGQLPLGAYRSHPFLAMVLAFAYFHHDTRLNRLRAVEAVAASLTFAKLRWSKLAPIERLAMTVAECAAYRGLGRPDAGIEQARNAARTLDELDIHTRDRLLNNLGPITVHIALSLYYGGAATEAIPILERAASLTPQENASAHFEANALLAAMHVFEGNTPQARVIARQLRQPAWPRELRQGMIGLGAEAADAALDLEDGRYDEAVARCQSALLREPSQEHWPWFVRVRSLALLAQGQAATALTLLDADERPGAHMAISRHMKRYVAATRAEVLAALGRLSDAKAALFDHDRSVLASVVSARIFLLQGDAADSLARLNQVEARSHDLRHWVGVLLLRAVCGSRLGRLRLRDDNLRQALVVMQQFELKQPFRLLSPSDRDALLAAAPEGFDTLVATLAHDGAYWPEPGADVRLTPRERDVLALLERGADRAQVARELGLSANTVKVHLSGLYRKLGASTRDEAVARARLLGQVDMS